MTGNFNFKQRVDFDDNSLNFNKEKQEAFGKTNMSGFIKPNNFLGDSFFSGRSIGTNGGGLAAKLSNALSKIVHKNNAN